MAIELKMPALSPTMEEGTLARWLVKVGDTIERGDRIGDMGNTGRSTGSHLHYEIRVGGKAVNPMKYIEAGRNVL